MLTIPTAVKLWYCPEATDMRLGYDGLLARVRSRLLADPLSALLLAILGFVAALVYLYSLGYMADDPGKRRFFVYLDLFVTAMAVLVLAGNLAVLLIGWTGVGISSFLLISFWRDRPGTLGAGLQALAANAIGDGALLIAAAIVRSGCGALVSLGTPECTRGPGGAEFLAVLLFIAAAAKSAQAGSQRDDRGRDGDVEPDLDQVQQIHRIRCPEAVFGPVPGHDLKSRCPWQRRPGFVVNVRNLR